MNGQWNSKIAILIDKRPPLAWKPPDSVIQTKRTKIDVREELQYTALITRRTAKLDTRMLPDKYREIEFSHGDAAKEHYPKAKNHVAKVTEYEKVRNYNMKWRYTSRSWSS